jgi:hypothetical protein
MSPNALTWAWRIGMAGVVVVVLALFSINRLERDEWRDSVTILGLPAIFLLLAGIGRAIVSRLDAIELALRERRP